MKKFHLALLLAVMCTITSWAQEKFVSGGRTRNIIVYAPKNLPDNSPLLISMHGYNQDANYQRSQAKYELVADTAKFVVVYPDGEGRSWDLGGTKDINFILDIIEEMHKRHNINKNRVYLSGFSMGGMMTYYAMNKIADKIAAFAPVSGYNMGGPNATSSRPIPIIHVHGTTDDVCSYSPVQSHIDAWVKRNKCETTPQTYKVFPNKPGTATMYRYRNGQDGVEVAHLKLPNKGHWHSNDPECAMSNIEIWNFCKRFSLIAGPTATSVSPASGCFDMQSEVHRQFSVTVDKDAIVGKVKATLVKGTSTITLKLVETENGKTLTFNVPEGKNIANGTWTLCVTGLESEDGGKGGDITASYTYGIEEVGDVMALDTVLTQDWYSQRDAIGEGIPKGWLRVNSNSSGKDEKKGGEANTGGVRMKYFTTDGQITAGMYMSAREYDKVEFTYGNYSGDYLKMRKGRYILSFNTTYWTQGAQTDKNTMTVALLNRSTGEEVWSSVVQPQGCVQEKSDIKVTQCAHHELICEAPSATNYLLRFTYSAGWNGIILGQPMITTCPSDADRYKGGFLRTLKEAKEMSERLHGANVEANATQVNTLDEAIAEYDSFNTISPVEYEAARNVLLSAMLPLEAVAISSVVTDQQHSTANEQMYDLTGRTLLTAPRKGVYIKGGKKIVAGMR